MLSHIFNEHLRLAAVSVAGLVLRAAAAADADDSVDSRGEPRTFTITELAQEFDITPRAIRFYEDVGLMEPARAGRNRVVAPTPRRFRSLVRVGGVRPTLLVQN